MFKIREIWKGLVGVYGKCRYFVWSKVRKLEKKLLYEVFGIYVLRLCSEINYKIFYIKGD